MIKAKNSLSTALIILAAIAFTSLALTPNDGPSICDSNSYFDQTTLKCTKCISDDVSKTTPSLESNSKFPHFI